MALMALIRKPRENIKIKVLIPIHQTITCQIMLKENLIKEEM
jgi:hypothetical protein